MRIETLKSIIKMLENTASKDETRYHLGCVEIASGFITATDGHIMGRCRLDDEEFKQFPSSKYYIFRDEIGFLKTILKKNKYGVILDAEITEKEIKIEGKKITVDEVRYPNVEQFVPRYDDSTVIAFNPELLLKLAVSMGTESKKPKSVKLYIKDSLTPIKVQIDGNEGVLMPVRM